MSEKLKVAIIGTGSRGTFAFTEILTKRDDVEIVAYCDVNPVRAKAAAEIFKLNLNIYKTIDEMAEKETLDGVIITTPDCYHHECTMKALSHNWNVLVDKPLATNVKDCKEIISYAKEVGKTVMIGFNLRHHAVLKELKKIITDGTLGKVFLCENREFYDGGRTYMSRWNRFFKSTGGLFIHKGSHDFDIFNWLLDFPKPLRVSAFASVNVLDKNHLPFEKEEGIEPGPGCNTCYYKDKCRDKYMLSEEDLKMWGEEAQAVDNYLKNTCMYTSEKDNHDNGIALVEYENDIKVSHMECFMGSKGDRLYTICGDKAVAEVSLTNRTITITPRWGGEIVTRQIPSNAGGHGGADPLLVDTFCKVLKNEDVPNSTMEHGMLSTAVGQAAEMSRREHRMVEISEIL